MSQNRVAMLNNYPISWQHRYAAKNYLLVDPTVRHAMRSSVPMLWPPREADAIALTELVRIDLGRYITSSYAGPARQIEAILFESSLLERVQAAVERSARGNLLLLSPAVTQDVREQVRRILASAAGRVVAIASAEAPLHLRRGSSR
jgi:type III secretory pathway component EscV